MIQESGALNKSRINCFMFMDARMVAQLPLQNPTPEQIATHLLHLRVIMHQCRELHAHQACVLNWNSWVEDHNDDNMAAVYANQTESEAEAEERLSGEESEGWSSAVPNSSAA